ncbi:MAG: FKBP-type peptidyl-prolyl cis-trans isomerase [Bacteroidales bacterium]|nr:FKBP-type peptidyl-prolyl cis-trans isomerase [Bacteroidales bacterium]
MKLAKKYNCIILVLSVVITIMTSCTIESYVTRKRDADLEITKYLNDNKLNVSTNTSGLVFISMEDGDGGYPKPGDRVAFHYKGYYLNGEMFDSSYDKSYPLVVQLGEGMLIKGMEEALLSMNKGSKSKIIVPFYLAYNDMDNAPVPPYSNLIFELEIIDFTSGK